jgi:NarL family two-component system response regulator LiaR
MGRTIVLSIATDPALSFRVFQSGAMGLVSKRQPPGEVLTAIRKVHAGEAWLGRAMAAQVLDLARSNDRRITSQTPVLLARDRQLITLVGEGWRNAEIARHLVASEATVRACLRSIYRKLGLSGRFAVMVYAAQHGLVSTRPQVRSVPSIRPCDELTSSGWPPGEGPKRNRGPAKPTGSKTGVS